MIGTAALGDDALAQVPAELALASPEPYARLLAAPPADVIYLVELNAYIDPGETPTEAVLIAYLNGYNHRRYILIDSDSQVFI